MVNAAQLGMLGALGALAQDTPTVSADDTGRTIALVIGALLGLALLLAVLTIWYWRRTDPRKAGRSAPAQAPVAMAATTAGSAPGRRSVTARPGARRGAGASPGGRTSGVEGTAADRGISAEEWLRLTGARQSTPSDRT